MRHFHDRVAHSTFNHRDVRDAIKSAQRHANGCINRKMSNNERIERMACIMYHFTTLSLRSVRAQFDRQINRSVLLILIGIENAWRTSVVRERVTRHKGTANTDAPRVEREFP